MAYKLAVQCANSTTFLPSVLVYHIVDIPISALGLLGNLLIVLVWRRDNYHPTRFLLMALAVCHSFSLIFKHTWWFVKQWPILCLLVHIPQGVSANTNLFMTTIHYLWLSFPPASPFFRKKRLVAGIFLIFVWTVVLRCAVLAYVFMKKGSYTWMKVTLNLIGKYMPYLLQLAVIVLMLCRHRSHRRVAMLAGSLLPPHGRHSPGATPRKGQSRSLSVGRTLSSQYHSSGLQSVASMTASRLQRYLCDLEREQSLTKAVVVMSVVPASLLLVPLIAIHSVSSIWPSAVHEISSSVIYSYQAFLLLALLPSFREPFKDACGGSFCHKTCKSFCHKTCGTFCHKTCGTFCHKCRSCCIKTCGSCCLKVCCDGSCCERWCGSEETSSQDDGQAACVTTSESSSIDRIDSVTRSITAVSGRSRRLSLVKEMNEDSPVESWSSTVLFTGPSDQGQGQGIGPANSSDSDSDSEDSDSSSSSDEQEQGQGQGQGQGVAQTTIEKN